MSHIYELPRYELPRYELLRYELPRAWWQDLPRRPDHRGAFLARQRRIRGPLTVALAEDRLREPSPEAMHIRRLASILKIEIVRMAARTHGSASRHARVIVCPPLVSAFACATGLHELGHTQTQHLCRPPQHAPVTTATGSLICVPCEILSWRWAIAHVYRGEWTAEHQANLRQGLNSYRRWATPGEQRDIDALTLNTGDTMMRHERAVDDRPTIPIRRIMRHVRLTPCAMCRTPRSSSLRADGTTLCTTCAAVARERARRGRS